MNETAGSTTETPESVLELVTRAIDLADDYDGDFQELISTTSVKALSDEDKRSLFTRIVEILHNGGLEPDDEQRARIADTVRREVDGFMKSTGSGSAPKSGGKPAKPGAGSSSADDILLVERYGHIPHMYVPTPVFKGVPVAMREGFIDITTVNLWKGNHRVELYVEEFREREGREPEDHELLALLHGDLIDHVGRSDPFDIRPLAQSIAEKGVERPPILTATGEPKDGNRRIAAAKYVLSHKGFTEEQRERARWVKVWIMPDTTEDVVEAVVVAMNFESDHKRPWEEYIKARLVVDRYRSTLDARIGSGERFTSAMERGIKQGVATHFAIGVSDVSRYIEMVRWAADFEAYHVEERGMDSAKVRYKANDIFQWFYEIQAGRGAATKLTTKLMGDDDLKAIVYDLMYDVIDSGAQVRALHKVVADEPSLKLLTQAHEQAPSSPSEAQALITAAIAEAAKNTTTRRVGFEQFAKTAADRFGSAPPKQWEGIDTQLLRDLRKVLSGAVGAIDGILADRDMGVVKAGVE